MLKLGEKFRDIYYPYRVFTALAVFFLSGILVASFAHLDFGRSWPVFLFIGILVIFVAFINFLLKNRFLVLSSFCLFTLLFGLFVYSRFESIHKPDLPFGQTVEISGRVAGLPQISATSQKLIIETVINGKNTRLLVTAPHFPEYEYGDILRFSGKVIPPPVFSDFNYRDYLKRYLVYGVVMNPSEITYLGYDHNLGRLILRGLYEASSYFESGLNRAIAEPEASLAAGILLGIKRNIPTDLMNNLNATSLTHIIALSGYNVTIIITVFSIILLGHLSRRQVFWLGVIFVLLFVLMTGAASSVVRAAIFSLLILFGMTIGRKADQTNLMLLAALIMVIMNPFVLRFDSGFDLSFLAFAGIIYLSPLIQKIFDRPILRKTPQYLKIALAETLGAQLAVLPLIWFVFGRLSIIGPIANLLIVPIIPLAMLLIFLVGIFSLVYWPVGQLINFLLWPVLAYIICMVHILAKLPVSSIGR